MEKGETINPNGRPKGAVSFKTIAEKILDGVIDFEDLNGRRKLTRREAMIVRIMDDAINGVNEKVRLDAVKFIIERMEGKAVETVQQTVSFSQPETMTDAQIEAIVKAMTTP